MRIRSIIIEDEPLAQKVLKKYIQDFPTIELCGVFNDSIKAQPFVHSLKPDLIFLDINLPVVSGISFLKSLNNPPLIIFTTAYPDFALEGYELNAVDYLLKPFSFERFIKAVNKASEKWQLSKPERQNTVEDFIFIKVDKKLYRIGFEDILYFEALDDYVKVITQSKHYLTNNTLKNLLDDLPTTKFVRVHKSFIVAVSKIDYVEGNYVRIGNAEVPVGSVYKEDLVSLYKIRKK